MNTYSLYISTQLDKTGLPAADATKLAQTIGILMATAKRTTTRAGTLHYVADEKESITTAVILEVDTDILLPRSLDDNSLRGTGTEIGLPGMARLFRASSDNRDQNRAEGLLRPYPLAGDTVVLITGKSVESQLDRQVTILGDADDLNGELNVIVGLNNADAIDGVYQAPFDSAQGFAILGPMRANVTRPVREVGAVVQMSGDRFLPPSVTVSRPTTQRLTS